MNSRALLYIVLSFLLVSVLANDVTLTEEPKKKVNIELGTPAPFKGHEHFPQETELYKKQPKIHNGEIPKENKQKKDLVEELSLENLKLGKSVQEREAKKVDKENPKLNSKTGLKAQTGQKTSEPIKEKELNEWDSWSLFNEENEIFSKMKRNLAKIRSRLFHSSFFRRPALRGSVFDSIFDDIWNDDFPDFGTMLDDNFNDFLPSNINDQARVEPKKELNSKAVLKQDAPKYQKSFHKRNPLSIMKKENEYRVMMELPGYLKKDVEISLRRTGIHNRYVLNIKGTKSTSGGKVAFSRSHVISNEEIEPSDVSASFDKGSLTVKIPTKSTKNPNLNKLHKIKID